MNKQQLKDITGKYYRKLKKQFKRIKSGYDPEEIHQFRITYKKLRAFFRMLARQRDSATALQIFRKIKKLYNVCGVIRDLQLQQQQVIGCAKQEQLKIKSYLHFLQKRIDKQKQQLPGIAFKKQMNKCKRKTDAAIPEDFSFNDFRDYVVKKKGEISAVILSGRFIDDDLHAIRKGLKDLFYNLKIYKALHPGTVSGFVFNGKDDLYTTELPDELGSFQDICTTIDLLKWYRLNHWDAYKKQQLELVKNNFLQKKLTLKKMLVKKLANSFLPVFFSGK